MGKQHIDGLPILNAKQVVTLHITKSDVEHADPKDPGRCAIARCLRRQGAKDVKVHLARTYVRNNDGNWIRYATPLALRYELIAFDRGGRFAPGDYALRPLIPSRRPTGKRLGSPELPPARRKRAVAKRRRPPVHMVTDVREGPA